MYLRSIEAATSVIAVELIAAEVRSEDDISNLFRKVGSEPEGGLFVLPDSHNVVHRKQIIELSAQYRLPAIYYFRYFASERWPHFLRAGRNGFVRAYRVVCRQNS